jgi:hypothetical protein
MNRPTRWRDQGPDDVRELLRHAPRTRDLGPDDRARTRARVAQLGGIAAVAGGLTLVQSAALGAGLAVLTVLAVELAPSSWLSSAPPLAPSPSPARSAVLAPAPLASVAPSRSSAPPLASSPPLVDAPPPRSASRRIEAPPLADDPPAPAPALPRAPDTLAEEAALLERARAALASSPSSALQRTEEHAAQFPAGKLAMERELLAIAALGRLGRRAEARARAESLLERARGSLYEERIRQLLDGLR